MQHLIVIMHQNPISKGSHKSFMLTSILSLLIELVAPKSNLTSDLGEFGTFFDLKIKWQDQNLES